MKKWIWAFVVLGLISCTEKTYKPKDLKKLTHEALLKRAESGERPPEGVVLKDQQGMVISQDSVSKIIDIQKYTTDVYVDDEGVIKEYIIRTANDEDLAFRKKMQRIIEKQMDALNKIEIVDVDCDQIIDRLKELEKSDQQIRKDLESFDMDQDRRNIAETISILENCPEEVQQLDASSINSVWLLIQHASGEYRKKYIYLFEDWADKNLLSKTSLAMMKDRMYMDEDLPQVYGTQVVKDQETGKWKLYDLDQPEYVNQRRAEVGFGPIQEYLSRWDIQFEVIQKGQ